MAALVHDRASARLLHQLYGVPDQARVMYDGCAGRPTQRLLRQKAYQIVALDEVPALVEEEAAIEIAVPGKAEVGARLTHRRGGRFPLFGQQGIRHAVGE